MAIAGFLAIEVGQLLSVKPFVALLIPCRSYEDDVQNQLNFLIRAAALSGFKTLNYGKWNSESCADYGPANNSLSIC